MKRVALLPVHLGLASSALTTDKVAHFYLWLAELIEGDRCRFAKEETRIALALDNSAIEINSPQILNRFVEHVKKRSKSANLIIADLATSQSGLLRGGILIHLAHAIQMVLDQPSKVRFVVILPELPPREELFRIMLDRFILRKRVVLVGANGDAVGQTPSFDSTKYSAHFARLADDPATRFKTKLIRRLGHFKMKVDGEHRACRRYFYDASYCIKELAELCAKQIDSLYGKGGQPLILCEQPVSGWLRDALLVLANERDVPLVNTQEFLSAPTKYANGGIPLLVVPAVYSGQSLVRLLKELRERDENVRLNILAVLSEDGDKDKTRKINAGGRTWVISYFAKVNQHEYAIGECQMCKLGLPETEPLQGDRTAMLTTYDMWNMVWEAGWKDEEDVPRYRKSLGKVPRLPELIEQNGTWLASKFRQVIRMSDNILTSDLVVLCPDEKGSRVFTEFLHAVFGVTVIRIPREILNLFRTHKLNTRKLDAIASLQPDWQIRISTIHSGRLVLMDEFNASGGTRQRLKDFARHFGQEVYCYFSIVDWNPKASRISEVETYALYECQMIDKSRVSATPGEK
ncbi:MAG: hypothetical protein WB729_11245 [Candidatus Sulfotelmatobacter sp.]